MATRTGNPCEPYPYRGARGAKGGGGVVGGKLARRETAAIRNSRNVRLYGFSQLWLWFAIIAKVQ